MQVTHTIADHLSPCIVCSCLSHVGARHRLSVSAPTPTICRTLVAASRLRHLRRLDASLCGSVDDGALVHLTACPSLAEVNVRSCWQLSEQGGVRTGC